MYIQGRAAEFEPRKRPEFQLGADIADDAYGCLLSRFRKPDTAAALRAVAARVAKTDRFPIYALQYVQGIVAVVPLANMAPTISLDHQRQRIAAWLAQFDLDGVRDHLIETALRYAYGERGVPLVTMVLPQSYAADQFVTLTALGTFSLTHHDSPVADWRRQYWSMVDKMYPLYLKKRREGNREATRRAFKNAWRGWPNPE